MFSLNSDARDVSPPALSIRTSMRKRAPVSYTPSHPLDDTNIWEPGRSASPEQVRKKPKKQEEDDDDLILDIHAYVKSTVKRVNKFEQDIAARAAAAEKEKEVVVSSSPTSTASPQSTSNWVKTTAAVPPVLRTPPKPASTSSPTKTSRKKSAQSNRTKPATPARARISHFFKPLPTPPAHSFTSTLTIPYPSQVAQQHTTSSQAMPSSRFPPRNRKLTSKAAAALTTSPTIKTPTRPRRCTSCLRDHRTCDARRPACSRCVKKGVLCLYNHEADENGAAEEAGEGGLGGVVATIEKEESGKEEPRPRRVNRRRQPLVQEGENDEEGDGLDVEAEDEHGEAEGNGEDIFDETTKLYEEEFLAKQDEVENPGLVLKWTDGADK